jgi:hypothetical protein
MSSANELIEYARDCVRLAGLVGDDRQLREQLLDMARAWMRAAMDEESKPITSPVVAPVLLGMVGGDRGPAKGLEDQAMRR